MKRYQILILKSLLPKMLSRACPYRIPRSGEAGRKVDCFSVAIDSPGGEPFLLVLALKEGVLECKEWDGERYQRDATINLADINPDHIFVTHYYGLAEVRFSGVTDLVIGWFGRGPYLKLRMHLLQERFDTYFFVKRKLVTKERTDLLRFLMERHLEGEGSFKSFGLMTKLYSMKWVLHPEGDAQQQKLEFFLNALVDTGELRKNGDTYALTGHGLRAIEQNEEEERRHADNVTVQRRMLWLTGAILVFTAAQAGLFKLPLLVDLTKAAEKIIP